MRSPSSSDGACSSDGVSIGPFVVIEAGAQIGARTIVRAHSVIGAGASLGETASSTRA